MAKNYAKQQGEAEAGIFSQVEPTFVEVEPDQETELEIDEVEDEDAAKKFAERQAVVTEMKAKIGYKAQVVPFNTARWIDGVVTGVLDDARAKNPLWVVKSLENGKIIRKAYGSELINVSEDEKVELPKRTSLKGGVQLSEKELMSQLADAYQNIGKYAEVVEFGEKTDEKTKALIIGAMLEKRSNRVMYRLRKEDNSVIHKVYGNGVDILEELDTVTFAKNAAKREKAAALTDPAKRAEYIAKEIERLQAEKVAIDAKIEALQETLQELQATELE